MEEDENEDEDEEEKDIDDKREGEIWMDLCVGGGGEYVRPKDSYMFL